MVSENRRSDRNPSLFHASRPETKSETKASELSGSDLIHPAGRLPPSATRTTRTGYSRKQPRRAVTATRPALHSPTARTSKGSGGPATTLGFDRAIPRSALLATRPRGVEFAASPRALSQARVAGVSVSSQWARLSAQRRTHVPHGADADWLISEISSECRGFLRTLRAGGCSDVSCRSTQRRAATRAGLPFANFARAACRPLRSPQTARPNHDLVVPKLRKWY